VLVRTTIDIIGAKDVVTKGRAPHKVTMLSWDAFCTFCGVVVSVSLTLYLVPLLLLSVVPQFRSQDLRAKYGDWAVVTGGTSGIGLSIARKLAAQGVNVCVVALEDKRFAPSIAALKSGYPSVEIRAVPVNLAKDPAAYTKAIRDATDEFVSMLLPIWVRFRCASPTC
jgi:short chain dehydrogenase